VKREVYLFVLIIDTNSFQNRFNEKFRFCIVLFYKDKVRQEYQIKTRSMEKMELDADLRLIDTEINRFEKKILQTPFEPLVKNS